MMSPGDLVKVVGVDICVIRVQVVVIHLRLVEDAGLGRSCCGSCVCVHLAVRPFGVAQESGFQCRVQRKKGLDQRRLRL